jgi:hypothetical protein
MTVDVARRGRRRARPTVDDSNPMLAPATTPSITIGELEQTVFDCPSCSRPLALGARRCPGCRTRLIGGVTLGKASGFAAVGLAVGLLVGAGGGLVFGLTHATASGPGPGSSAAPLGGANGGGKATTRPTSTAAAGASTKPAATGPSDIPPLARSAFSQLAATNGRLSTAATDLRAALAAKRFDASAVAQILRTLSADSIFGQQTAGRLATWSGSTALGTELDTFYTAIHDTAANGLAASVQNPAAYRSAGVAMIRLLDALPALDAAVRATSASAGVVLPE